MKKKVTSLLLTLMLALSLLPPTALAATGGDTLEAAALQLREAMVQRQDPVTVEFTVPDRVEDPRQFTHEIYDLALTHTGVPTEGDYLAYQNGGWNAQISYYGDSEGMHYSVTYYMQYYTTVQQEAAVTAEVDRVLASLALDGRSSYEKVCAIYDYITDNVSYDYENLNDDSYKLKCTCHNALLQHSAVCQGYSLLFYRLALECGVDARIISGIGNGGPHAWNIVKLGDRYYNLDSTWDAGRTSYSYFLCCDADFPDHAREDAFATPAFYTTYPMGDTDYDNTQPGHDHEMTKTAAKAATCTAAGNDAYYTCAGCGKYFADSAGKQEIAKDSWVIDAAGHSYTNKVTAPTCTAKGYTTHTCSACGDSYKDEYTTMKTLAQAKITSIANSSTGITVKWGKVTGATAYQVYRKVGTGSWKLIKTTTATSLTNTGLTNGNKYQYKVRAIVKVDGKIVNKGAYSAIKTMYRLTRPTLATGTKNIATRKIVVKWSKNTKVTGYQVKYVKGTTTKTVTVKGASTLTKTLSSLTKGATYKVYVRSYKTTVSGTNYYSAWSAYKSVKVNR